MDIERVIQSTKELLEIRGQNVEEFTSKLEEINTRDIMNEPVIIPLSNYIIVFATLKNSFKEFWSSIRNISSENFKEQYGSNKVILVLGEYPPSVTLQSLQQKDTQFHEVGGFIHIFLTKELMYNPTKHSLVPKHEKMSETEVKKLMEQLQLKKKTQLPFILKTDIISRWLGLKQGDVVKITRYSETSGEYYYFRCCV